MGVIESGGSVGGHQRSSKSSMRQSKPSNDTLIDSKKELNDLLSKIDKIEQKVENRNTTHQQVLTLSRTLVENIAGLLSPIPGTGTTVSWLTGKAFDSIGATSFNRAINNEIYNFESASDQVGHMLEQMVNDFSRFTNPKNNELADIKNVQTFITKIENNFNQILKKSQLPDHEKTNFRTQLTERLDAFKEKAMEQITPAKGVHESLINQTSELSDNRPASAPSRGVKLINFLRGRNNNSNNSELGSTDESDNPMHRRPHTR